MKHFQEWLTAALPITEGKKVGFLCGLIFGILILTLGFWRGIFLTITVSLGCWLGSFHDRKESFLAFGKDYTRRSTK